MAKFVTEVAAALNAREVRHVITYDYDDPYVIMHDYDDPYVVLSAPLLTILSGIRADCRSRALVP